MISYEPLPLLEACIFLTGRAMKISSADYLEGLTAEENEANSKLDKYAEIIGRIESRLTESITVDDEVINKLFAPIDNRTCERNIICSNNVCNALVKDMGLYALESCEQFFECIRNSVKSAPYAFISNVIDGECEDELDLPSVFKKVNNSGLASESKLLLLDLAVNTDEYIDLLEAAIVPVVKSFEDLKAEYSSLINIYRKNIERYEDAESYLKRFCDSNQRPDLNYELHPFIVGPQYRIIFYSRKTPGMLGCIGVLNDFISSKYTFSINTEAEMETIMAALGHKSRFRIIAKLAKTSLYGRELADYLNLSSGTVSQHIGILLQTGLITLSDSGSRVYYSLDRAKTKRFLEKLSRMLLPD